jgi:hypothetical protein
MASLTGLGVGALIARAVLKKTGAEDIASSSESRKKKKSNHPPVQPSSSWSS